MIELMQAQKIISGYIFSAGEEVRSKLQAEVRDMSTLSNLNMKQTYATADKKLFDFKASLSKSLKSFSLLPVSQYVNVAGKLLSVVYNHVCQKILEIKSFVPADAEALVKLIQPLVAYDPMEQDYPKIARSSDVNRLV